MHSLMLTPPCFPLRLLSALQDDLRSSLNKVIELENEEFWKNSRPPKKEEGFLHSELHMDIWTVGRCTMLSRDKTKSSS